MSDFEIGRRGLHRFECCYVLSTFYVSPLRWHYPDQVQRVGGMILVHPLSAAHPSSPINAR